MKSTGKPNDPLSRFSLGIFHINGLLMHSGDAITQSIGQSSARWQVLGRVGYAPHTVAQMARDMGHARQSVQRVANALASEGLVMYKDNPNDKRTQLVELTKRGGEVLAAIYAKQEEWSQHIMTKLDSGQLVEIAEALECIGQILTTDESNTRNVRGATDED
jgi:DNA-binding MarR family transcriptional regulator